MTCDAVQHRLLDGAAGPSDEAHLDSCEACRGLAAAHAAALQLRALTPIRPSRVRTRAVVARAGLVGAALIGVLAGQLLRDERAGSVAPPALAADGQKASPTPAPAQEEEWAAFVAFTRGLEQDLSRDVVRADPLVPSHGALSTWVAPASTVSSYSLEN
jgi:hypothetical protein